MDETTRDLLAGAGLSLPDADAAFFERLRELVVAANERMNLTRLTEPRDFWVKHVLDSILPFLLVPALRELPEKLLAADLGSGAGFPGLVLARLRPGWDVALVERTRKKAEFLEEAVETLGIGNAYVVPFDAHEAARRTPVLRRACAVVCARAVGRLADATRAAAPLVAGGGLVVHYKARLDDAEREEGAGTARRSGFVQEEPFAYVLPPDAQRTVVLSRSTRRRRSAGRRRRRARGRTPGDRAR